MENASKNLERKWYQKLHWQVFIAMAVGILVGYSPAGGFFAQYFGWLGDLFMRLLKMIIVPLVIVSIVAGVASAGGGKVVGRMFGKTLSYYVVSSLFAALVGLLMFNLINPGKGYPITDTGTQPPDLATPESPIDLLLNIVPTNFFASASAGDMLGIIFFSIVFGIALTTLPQKPRTKITDLVDILFKAMMSLTNGIIRLLPIGVFGLIVTLVGKTGLESFGNLFKYVLALGSGLSIHFLITIPLLLYFWGRVSPWKHLMNLREPLLVAFSTSSSAATLPVTLNTVQKKVGVSNRVTSFTLPMGATVNMDGTAIMECVGALFIAQALGAEIGFMTQVAVVITALLASIGAAAVPSAGLVVIFIILNVIGIGDNPEALLIVGGMLSIDRPLDMARTAVNVYSDSCAAVVVGKWEGETGINEKIHP
ncbi:MAG: dicarboxylate/amino acid:cation symporter [Flavobacteriaceae bacterium]|nr:dicarboxylate/amino acid:cation symporter [Flavobacteriaceae bacterium]MCY4215498.1 dicarboxylate/amino acid:cation symporter [Flavobacteriaceae bacterium]MCY4267552.1 dicarboxylate/amino acid:cation symporter [Flavobacteriaceae bacterium]